jgi:hypothetical protein
MYRRGRLWRLFGCGKLHRSREAVDQIFRVNGDRVVRSFKGASLDHTLPLLATMVNLRNHRSAYAFMGELYDQANGELLMWRHNKGEGQAFPLALALDLIDGLRGVMPYLRAENSPSDREVLYAQQCIELVSSVYPCLSIEERKEYRSILSSLSSGEHPVVSALLSPVQAARGRAARVDGLGGEDRTREYMMAMGLDGFLHSELDTDVHYNQSNDCLEIVDKRSRVKVHAIHWGEIRGEKQLERTRGIFLQENIDTIMVDIPPVLDRKRLARPEAADEKMLEYSQTLITQWPYLYKFHGKAELRGYYLASVFDREFQKERDGLFYYLFNSKDEVLDMTTNLLVQFSGVGDRTTHPSLYLAGLLAEERVIEAVGKVDNERAKLLSGMYNLYNLAGGLRQFEQALDSPCHQCASPGQIPVQVNSSRFYQLLDKIYRAEYESDRLPIIQSSMLVEATRRLEGKGVVYAGAAYGFDKMLRQYFQHRRQERLAGQPLPLQERRSHIMNVYRQSREYSTEEFWEKLALVENVMGTFESTLCQFIDLMQNQQYLVKYEMLKANLAEQQLISDWNPLYVDQDREEYCPVDNVVLPVKVEHNQPKKVIYHGDSKDFAFEQKVAQRFATLEKQKEEEFKKSPDSPKGRKIGLKKQEETEFAEVGGERGGRTTKPRPGKRLPPKH